MQRIGAKYDTVGTFLLDDSYGDHIERIEADTSGIEKKIRKIFIDWIKLGNTSTWGVLVDSLRASELNTLADSIQRVIDFCAKKNIDVKCERQSNHDFLEAATGNDSQWNLVLIVTSVLIPILFGVAVTVYFQCKGKITNSYLYRFFSMHHYYSISCSERLHLFLICFDFDNCLYYSW